MHESSCQKTRTYALQCSAAPYQTLHRRPFELALSTSNGSPFFFFPARVEAGLGQQAEGTGQLFVAAPLVGSGTGAVAHGDCRSSVSSSPHITRSVRISRTTRSCTLHNKGYGAYRVGAAVQEVG